MVFITVVSVPKLLANRYLLLKAHNKKIYIKKNKTLKINKTQDTHTCLQHYVTHSRCSQSCQFQLFLFKHKNIDCTFKLLNTFSGLPVKNLRTPSSDDIY